MKIIYNIDNVDPKYRPLITKAIMCMEDVIDHPIFLEILKDEIALSNDMEGELSMWRECIPAQIYAQLFPIDLMLHTYYTEDDVIGKGYKKTKDIYLNTKYLRNYDIILLDLMKVGSNILHEHSHDCGFSHDFSRTNRRPNSISYILNRVYERTFRRLYALPEVVKSKVKPIPWYKKIFKGWF